MRIYFFFSILKALTILISKKSIKDNTVRSKRTGYVYPVYAIFVNLEWNFVILCEIRMRIFFDVDNFSIDRSRKTTRADQKDIHIANSRHIATVYKDTALRKTLLVSFFRVIQNAFDFFFFLAFLSFKNDNNNNFFPNL